MESQVCLTPHISHDQLLQKLAEVDGYVIVQPITDCQVPSKLYEMLLFRKPILGLVDAGTTAQIILDYELGNVASPTDADQIAQVIRRTFIEPTSGGVVPRWDDAMRAFDGRSLTGDLARLLNDLVSQHDAADIDGEERLSADDVTRMRFREHRFPPGFQRIVENLQNLLFRVQQAGFHRIEYRELGRVDFGVKQPLWRVPC